MARAPAAAATTAAVEPRPRTDRGECTEAHRHGPRHGARLRLRGRHPMTSRMRSGSAALPRRPRRWPGGHDLEPAGPHRRQPGRRSIGQPSRHRCVSAAPTPRTTARRPRPGGWCPSRAVALLPGPHACPPDGRPPPSSPSTPSSSRSSRIGDCLPTTAPGRPRRAITWLPSSSGRMDLSSSSSQLVDAGLELVHAGGEHGWPSPRCVVQSQRVRRSARRAARRRRGHSDGRPRPSIPSGRCGSAGAARRAG